MSKNVIAVIPAFNEEKNIAKVIAETLLFCQRIIVVNDFSTDQTLKVLKDINDEKVTIINNKKNLGIGGSMKVGFTKALEYMPEIIIKIDGDGQHNPKDIPKFIKKLLDEDLELVKGNRFFVLESLENMPKIKVFGNLITTNLQKIVSGNYKISDPNNGFLAIKASKLKLINFKYLHNSYFFENSLTIVFNALNFKIGEISIKTVYKDEKSSIPLFLAAIKLLPVFAFFLFRKNLITAKHHLSANSILFFSIFILLFLNIFLNANFLWVVLVIMILFYIFIDVLNFLSK